MRQVVSVVSSLLLGLWLLAVASGCASISSAGGGKAASDLSREEALTRCIDAVPRETLLYPDAIAACMERHGWVYSVQSRR
jgi:hypothetical protein